MTDEQIIALIKTARQNGLTSGGTLGHHAGWCDDVADCLEELLDTTQRHRADIDRLTTELEAMRMECNSLKMRLACSRAGAVGEFMLRVLDLFPDDKSYAIISRTTIKRFAQEMTEGEQ